MTAPSQSSHPLGAIRLVRRTRSVPSSEKAGECRDHPRGAHGRSLGTRNPGIRSPNLDIHNHRSGNLVRTIRSPDPGIRNPEANKDRRATRKGRRGKSRAHQLGDRTDRLHPTLKGGRIIRRDVRIDHRRPTHSSMPLNNRNLPAGGREQINYSSTRRALTPARSGTKFRGLRHAVRNEEFRGPRSNSR
jgi:hypothetical protein